MEERNNCQKGAEKVSGGQAAVHCSAPALLLFVLLQLTTPSSVLSTAAMQPPNNLTVAVGDPAVFRCGQNPEPTMIIFTLYNNNGILNLTCPGGVIKQYPFQGTCEKKNGMLLAVWTNAKTSISDNSTQVVCQLRGNIETYTYTAFLHVYDKGNRYAIIIGCVIGGFFATVLVVGVFYISLRRNERLQKCFRGGREEDDNTTVIQ